VIEKKRILISPLDWGIGHATRCIPIINALIENDYEVIIGADGRPMHLLAKEFPKLEIIRIPGYNISYSKYLPMTFNILIQIPKLMWGIKQENQIIKNIIHDYNIDGIISDNRYGLYSTEVPCVFITHQLNIQSHFMSNYINKINYNYINKFSKCWIMDDEKENLAGELSKPPIVPKNSEFIGCQSRFKLGTETKKYKFLAIVSGPEPQRTIFEKGIIKALRKRQEKSLVILGKPEIESQQQIDNITVYSHLDAKDLNKAILQSDTIICRAGYSTIMDLAKLNKSAFLIPTPGQTEQEYLAKNLLQNKICYSQKQKDFDFELAMNEIEKFSGFTTKKHQKTNWEKLFSLF